VLERHVKQVVVTQPLKRRGSKSDSIDAWALADLWVCDSLVDVNAVRLWHDDFRPKACHPRNRPVYMPTVEGLP
jgi:hypothetical protein